MAENLERMQQSISELAREVATLGTDLRGTFKHLAKTVDDHHHSLYGADKAESGLTVRVDRLEQNDNRRSKQIWVIWSALVTGLVGACITLAVAKFGK